MFLDIKTACENLDAGIGRIDNPTAGTKVEFHVGRIIESLLDSGVPFYDALDAIDTVKELLVPGTNTRTISDGLIETLRVRKPELADAFRIRYGEGLTVMYPDGVNRPLSVATAREAAIQFLDRRGYRWGSELHQVSQDLVAACRRNGINPIQLSSLEELINVELSRRLGGLRLEEFRALAAATVTARLADVETLAAAPIPDKWPAIAEVVAHLSGYVVFFFGLVPPIERRSRLAALSKLPESEAGSAFRDVIARFVTSSHELAFEQVRARRRPVDFTLDSIKATCRRLMVLNTLTAGDMLPEADAFGARLIGRVAAFVWPEGTLAATSRPKLRRDILLMLFRRRAVPLVKLIRTLQVHPKHAEMALGPLEREGLVVRQRLSDGDLVIISVTGEEYCERDLKIKLRPYLSRL